MNQELIVRPLYGLERAPTDLVVYVDQARASWTTLTGILLLALCAIVGAITILGKLWGYVRRPCVVLGKGLRCPKIFRRHPWETARDFLRRNEPATQREWLWRGYTEAVLVEHYASLRDQAIAAAWTSWARLGNILRVHRWDGFYRLRLEVAARAKAQAKAKPQPGPPARVGVPRVPPRVPPRPNNWVCLCGTRNQLETNTCTECGTGRYR
jgi:hypothetical protein